MEPTQNRDQSLGPVVALVVIMGLIIIGGLYFWLTRPAASGEPGAATTTAEMGY